MFYNNRFVIIIIIILSLLLSVHFEQTGMGAGLNSLGRVYKMIDRGHKHVLQSRLRFPNLFSYTLNTLLTSLKKKYFQDNKPAKQSSHF